MTPQELKNSILQLAIQGKLVEQRPEEGTAEELFAQIQEEKQRLIAEKKSKKEKPLPEITEDGKPFDVPESWMWVRLTEFATLYNGRAYKQNELLSTGKYPVLRVGNLFTSNQWYYSNLELEEEKYCDVGDLLYSWSASFGPHIWKGGKTIYHYHIWKIEYSQYIDRSYLFYMLLADTEQIKRSGHGLAMIHVTKAGMEKRPFPLPPLAEQKRIVDKIEKLLPYIERYEQAWSKLEQFNSRFPEDMKKSLLQYSIQGKLVEQRPEEGTAEELFAQIQQEKQRLIAEKKIKKEKSLPEITDDEKPFDIPESWKWVYLIDLVEEKPSNGYSPKGVTYPTEIRNLTLTATTSGKFKDDAFKYVDIPEEDALKYWLRKNDLLIQRSNSRELVGTSCIYTGADNAYIYPDLMMRMRVLNGVDVQYIDYVLKSPMTRNYYMASASGTSESMPKINQKTVSFTLVPLPPLAEQKRIVKKLEQMLPLSERLK